MQPTSTRPAVPRQQDAASTRAGAPRPEPHRTSRPPRRGLIAVGVVAAVLAIALGTVAVVAFLRSSPDDGAPAAAPPPCSLLDKALVATLVPDGTPREDGNLCSYEGKDPQAGPKLSLTVNTVPDEGGKAGTEIASQHIKDTFKGVGQPVPGLGDESVSYEPPGSRTIIILFRVGNVIVSLTGSAPTGSPAATSPAGPSKAIASDVASRLRK